MAGLNLDDVPGSDGVRVQVLFFQLVQPLPVTVTGTLEFTLFEGKVKLSELHAQRPMQVWKFPPETLPRHLFRSMVGWGYTMELRWKRPPKTSVVSLAARYVPSEGSPLHSHPVVIMVGAKRRGELRSRFRRE